MCPPNRIVFAGLLLLSLTGIAQPKKPDEKIVQVSLVPGIGTNGLHPGGFTNVFSVNLTSGYSKATLFLEVGVISNLNEEKTRGLQLAGLANLTGANAFAGLTEKEIREKSFQVLKQTLRDCNFPDLPMWSSTIRLVASLQAG